MLKIDFAFDKNLSQNVSFVKQIILTSITTNPLYDHVFKQ